MSQFIKIVNGMPVVQIGALRHSITILQETVSGTYDASGVAASTWTTLTTCNAAIGTSGEGIKQPLDVQRGGQTVSQLYVQVVLFYVACPTLTPNMRILTDSGSTYVIQAAENVLELNVAWVLTCLALGVNI